MKRDLILSIQKKKNILGNYFPEKLFSELKSLWFQQNICMWLSTEIPEVLSPGSYWIFFPLRLY